MTVGIVAVIPGGVVAIADGRTSKVFEDEIVSDLTRKVLCTSFGTTVVTFGVTSVHDEAMSTLRAGQAPGSGAEAIAMANAALAGAWSRFASSLGPDVDRTHTGLRAALMVAGVDETGPYLGAAMIDFQGPLVVGPAYTPFGHAVLGAEAFGSSDTFIKQMNHQRQSIAAHDAPIDIARKIVDAAATTIAAMAQHDRTVGGQIHYRILLADGTAIDGDHPGELAVAA